MDFFIYSRDFLLTVYSTFVKINGVDEVNQQKNNLGANHVIGHLERPSWRSKP